MIHSQCRSVHM